MNRGIIVVGAILLMCCNLVSGQVAFGEPEVINEGWKFILSDPQNAQAPDFDDNAWSNITLPHDWAFESDYTENGAQSANGGYKAGGVGWYRKTIDLNRRDIENKRLFLHFDAVYMNSEVWINGHYLGKRPYGYISFEYEISDYVKPGENVISVRVDNSLEPSARWYHGCGIYGNVLLVTTAETRFKNWGNFIAVVRSAEESADVVITSEIDGAYKTDGLRVVYVIKDKDGKKVGRYDADMVGEGRYEKNITIDNPDIWDIDTPSLYELEACLYDGKELLDKTVDNFGIRSVEWRPETGFWLNGRNVKIQGVCEHLEGGPIGAAWTENMMRWKIGMLKDMGCNAIRTAHNPQLPMFYDLCDEMGMLVLDEIFDGWSRKAPQDYGQQAFDEWWERDLRSFVRRDRNHPSIIAYSVGNETKGDVAPDLVRVCHEEDPYRLVTSGHSGSEHMDIFGVNGHSERKNFITGYKVSDKAFLGTETPHTWQVKGYYRTQTWYRDGYPNEKQDPFETPDLTDKEVFYYEWTASENMKNGKQHYNSSYDNAFVRINARQNMEVLRDSAWYSGSFRWTGFDYLGEASFVHGGWPFRAFMGGVIDLAGFPKDHYYLYQSQWTETPMLHILPHWTHQYLEEGTEIPVWAYSNCDSVELFLNGRSLGVKEPGDRWYEMQCEWLVPWEEGILEAVAFSDGKEVARAIQKTADTPSQIEISKEDSPLTGSDSDIHIFTISLYDDNGTIFPYGENRVVWSVDGGSEVYSAENGCPVDVDPNFNATSRKAFMGQLRLFVKPQSKRDIIYLASILGDKNLKFGNRVAIDVTAINIDGKVQNNLKPEIYYTLDGSDPSVNGIQYASPFVVDPETVVKAVVIVDKNIKLVLEEEFGENKGLCWDMPSDVDLCDIQAEYCEIGTSRVATDISGFQSEGYVLVDGDACIEFYQENDGAKQQSNLYMGYAPITNGKLTVELYNNGVKASEQTIDLNASERNKWTSAKMPVVLNNGANSIKLLIKGQGQIGVDWFEFRE